MKKFKKIISIIMVAAVIASIVVVGTVSTSASGTGAGLAEWALEAYRDGWSYVWGGSEPGGVDCSGLIYSYAGGYRGGDAITFNSDWRYSLGGSIPNIHGLGLYKPGHVGVYVGNGMAVDARGSDYGVCYESVFSHGWTQYYKVPGVSYPDTGWVKFDGDYYYYENGEYLADTSRTIDGTTYYFASSGISSSTPSDTTSTASVSSSSSSSSSTDNGYLKKGSTGTKVEELQTRLQELGYYNGVIDGDFGENTEKAFKLFQKAAGLYVDGIAGNDTEYLFADDAPVYIAETAKSSESAETVEKAETELADTGVSAEEAEAEEQAEEESPAALRYAVGDYSDDIVPIQEKLISLGYLEGDADGDFGSMTEEAVKAFQTANGLEATGVVEQSTYDKLFSESAVAMKVNDAKPAEDAASVDTGAAVAAAAAPAPANTSSAPNTDVEKTTTELSSKGVAAVAESPLFQRGANATNFEFLLWLVVMIVVMMIAFSIVYMVEKKKQRAAYSGRRFQ